MLNIYDLKEISQEKLDIIIKRSTVDIDSVKNKVKEIINDVQNKGDYALKQYTKIFDNVELKSFKVTEKEIKNAKKNFDEKLLFQIKKQISYSKKFHKNQLRKEYKIEIEKGIILGERYTPIDSVGLYVPGGKAAYPTVLQILAVPAKIANVLRIVVCTPPNKDGKVSDSILVIADLLGIKEIYKIGGAQAIAALALGTKSIIPVKKVVGPGNIYVNCAKLLLFGKIDIDMPAGPSEALIIADSNANPTFVAADILARCEHDEKASAVLITDSKYFAISVNREIKRQFKYLKRKEIIKRSLNRYSAILVSSDWEKIIDFTNDYAPEHLQLMVKNFWEVLSKIKNAGSIFLGYYSPVAIGDYASGTNHVLPTGQFAKMFSPVGVETFQKKSEFQYITKEGIEKLEPIVKELSAVEGFDGHYNSVKVRLDK
jgi:histidinol dehydrogenase